MSVKRLAEISLGAAILFCGAGLNLAHAKPFMIVGNDEKVWWDDDGKTLLSAPGKDTVMIVDLANPEAPRSSLRCRWRIRSSDHRLISTSTRQARSRWWPIRSM